jgi:hypothetical protein
MAMKKLSFLTLLFLSLVFSANAQSNEESKVKSAVEFWTKHGGYQQESIGIDHCGILDYGHSSGKVENKTDFINNVFAVDPFLRIDATDFDIKFYATLPLCDTTSFRSYQCRKAGYHQLHVLQVWVKEKKEWKLTAVGRR